MFSCYCELSLLCAFVISLSGISKEEIHRIRHGLLGAYNHFVPLNLVILLKFTLCTKGTIIGGRGSFAFIVHYSFSTHDMHLCQSSLLAFAYYSSRIKSTK